MISVATCVYQDKTRLLSRQKYFVATTPFLRQIFVATNTILYACRDKNVFSRKNLSLQTYFVVTNIIMVRQKFCRGKHTFVATKDVVCRNKHVFVCCDKTFVTTNIILVAAPANDNKDTRSLSRTCVV